MTKILKSITILLSLFSILPVHAQQSNTPRFHSAHSNRNTLHKAAFDSNMSTYDVIYQKLNFNVDPNIYYITGDVSFYYKALNNLDSLILNLSDSLNVDSIKQRNNKINFTHQANLLQIDIENINISNIDSISIYYQGKPTKENNSFFINVQDSINHIPVLATLSEPYSSSDWWPCKNTLTDKIDSIDISISCPIENKAVSLGLLKNTEIKGAIISYNWQHRYPVSPYLVSITVSNYTEYHSYIHYNEDDSLIFLNYLYQNNLQHKKTNIDKTEFFFKLYSSLFINYPFSNEKYGHVEFPIKGGMEHQTISSMGVFDFEIISHELAHQWFGDYITCGSWEDIWLNEGFATYCTGLCYENYKNGYWWDSWKNVTLSHIVQDSTGSVFPTDTSNVSTLFSARLTYRKAAYLLHMIRWTIGDNNFFQAIQNYLNDTELSFSFAKTPNLISHFEQQADTSLSTFMNDWFYGEGYPIFNIKWIQNNKQNLQIKINQNSALNDNHFFKLFIPIRLIGDNDSIDLKLNLQENNQIFNINLDFKINSIVFDPYLWIITKNSSIINENIHQTGINIYPNPCQNKLTIKTNETILDINLIDGKGCSINAPIQKNIINLESFSSGIYFIKIKTTQNLYLKKIIKN